MALVEPSTLVPEPRNFKAGGYLQEVPMDPWGRNYLYLYPGENGEVDIFSYGADGLPGGEGQSADLGNWSSEQR
jgi:general secretion pathway protein G